MKVQILFLLSAFTFLVIDAAMIRSPITPPRLLGGPEESPFMKRGIWRNLCCLSSNPEISYRPPTYKNVAHHLRFNPNEYNATYQYILTYLKEIVRFSDGIIGVLEDYKAFKAAQPEKKEKILSDAIDIWKESFSVLSSMKTKDWDALFERANEEESSYLKEYSEKAKERTKYLRFLIWFYLPNEPNISPFIDEGDPDCSLSMKL